MNELMPGAAAPIQLTDLGYDLYLGNNRGTEYSLGHEWIASPGQNPQVYWNFSYEEFALDVLANTEAMYKSAGARGWYFGYS